MCEGGGRWGEGGGRAFYYTYRDDIQREKIVLCLKTRLEILLVLIGKFQGLDGPGKPRTHTPVRYRSRYRYRGVERNAGNPFIDGRGRRRRMRGWLDMVERSAIRDRRTLVERRDIPSYSFNGP
jgi:hypothetical protein